MKSKRNTKMVRATFRGYARGAAHWRGPQEHTVDVIAETPGQVREILASPGGYGGITDLQIEVLHDRVVIHPAKHPGRLGCWWKGFSGYDLWALPLVLLAGGVLLWLAVSTLLYMLLDLLGR
jgi:hypothetical protein